MEYSPVACMRQSSRCCRSDSLGCLPRNFPLAGDGRALAGAQAVEIGFELGEGTRILKNSFPVGSPGS